MFKIKTFTLIALLVSSINCLAALPYPCDKAVAKKVEKAIKSYVDRKTGLRSNEGDIIGLQCIKNHATATVHPKKPVTDDARVYLIFQNHQWIVQSLGTDFDQTFLKTLPREFQFQNQ